MSRYFYRKATVFLSMLLLWFISSILFPFDEGFYLTLKIPTFFPSSYLISTIWILIYFLNTISIYNLIKNYEIDNDYYFILIINYLFNQMFSLFFFFFHSLMLSLITITTISITGIFLYIETKKINKVSAYLLTPYYIWSIFSLVLFIIICVLN